MNPTLIIVTLTLILAGCAHLGGPKQTTSEVALAKPYVEDIVSQSPRANPKINKADCPKSKKLWKKFSWKLLLRSANACVAADRWKQLSQVANHMAIIQPHSPWGPYYLSLVAEHKGHLDRALWLVDLAQKRAPNLGLLHYQKGRLLWTRKEFSNGINLIETALKRDPNLVEAHLFLGQIYWRDLMPKKAKKHFTKVIKIEKENFVATQALAKISKAMGENGDAIKFFKKAVVMKPNSLDLRLELASLYEEEDEAQALSTYRLIRGLMRNKRLKGRLEFNLDKKIAGLEKKMTGTTEKNVQRKPAKEDGK